MKSIAHSLTDLQSRFRFLTGKITKWPVRIEVLENYSERSDKLNRTFHMHFAEAAKFFGWTEKYAKRFAKYHYGLPILASRHNKKTGELTEDGKYWSDLLERLELWPYEARIDAMEKIPVTSEMTNAEGAQFVDTYMREWQLSGCSLTDPSTIDPEYYRDLEKEMVSRGR